MSLSEDLLNHALSLVRFTFNEGRLEEVSLRRAVSACYYSLFHQINRDAVALLAPNVELKTNHRIQRWFDHGEMRKVCGRFLPARLEQPLRDLIGDSASKDLQTVARSFVQLQDARHKADYDLGYQLTESDAIQLIQLTVDAKGAWERLNGSAEANVFILSLLLWQNWGKERT